MNKWIPILIGSFLAITFAYALVENQVYTQQEVNNLNFLTEKYSIHQETPFSLRGSEVFAVFSWVSLNQNKSVGDYLAIRDKVLVSIDYKLIVECDNDPTKTSQDCIDLFKFLVNQSISEQISEKINQYNGFKTRIVKRPLDFTGITLTDSELNN